jgi:hypothetical protein
MDLFPHSSGTIHYPLKIEESAPSASDEIGSTRRKKWLTQRHSAILLSVGSRCDALDGSLRR